MQPRRRTKQRVFLHYGTTDQTSILQLSDVLAGVLIFQTLRRYFLLSFEGCYKGTSVRCAMP